MHDRVVFVIITCVILGCCDRLKNSVSPVGNDAGVTPSGDAAVQPVKEPKMPLFDGFEAEAVAGFLATGRFAITWRAVSRSVSMRCERTAARIEPALSRSLAPPIPLSE